MSALYMKCVSDARKNAVTTRGHKHINTGFYYGSAKDSKLACEVTITRSSANGNFRMIVVTPTAVNQKTHYIELN